MQLNIFSKRSVDTKIVNNQPNIVRKAIKIRKNIKADVCSAINPTPLLTKLEMAPLTQ